MSKISDLDLDAQVGEVPQPVACLSRCLLPAGIDKVRKGVLQCYSSAIYAATNSHAP